VNFSAEPLAETIFEVGNVNIPRDRLIGRRLVNGSGFTRLQGGDQNLRSADIQAISDDRGLRDLLGSVANPKMTLA